MPHEPDASGPDGRKGMGAREPERARTYLLMREGQDNKTQAGPGRESTLLLTPSARAGRRGAEPDAGG